MRKDRTELFEETFRPLATAAVGSGALTLGVLGFTGEAWGSLPPEARDLLAAAARTAFLVFTLIAITGAVSFLVRTRTGPGLVALVNLFSAALFIGGVFVCGLVVSRALSMGRPQAPPPEPVAVLMAAGVVGAGALIAALLLNWLIDVGRAAMNRPGSGEDEA